MHITYMKCTCEATGTSGLFAVDDGARILLSALQPMACNSDDSMCDVMTPGGQFVTICKYQFVTIYTHSQRAATHGLQP